MSTAELLNSLLRVLDARALSVRTAEGHDRAELSEGPPERVALLLADDAFEPEAESGSAASPPSPPIPERAASGELRLALPLEDGNWRRGSLRVLLAPDRTADHRTVQMASVAAKLVGLRGAGESRSLPLSVARVLSDLGVAAESYESLVSGITAAVCPLVGAAGAGVALWEENEAYVQMLPGSLGVTAELVASSQASRSDPHSRAARVIETRSPFVTNDALVDMPEYRSFLKGFGIGRMVIVPLQVEDRLIGVAHIVNKAEPFDAADVRLLETVTPFAAAAVEHVHQRLELKRREALAVVVSRAATTIASGDPLAGFSTSLSEFCAEVGAQLVVVSFADRSRQIVVGPGAVTPELAAEFRAASSRGAVTVRVSAKRPAPRDPGDSGWDALHVPVLLAGKPEVTLSILRSPNEPFSDDELSAVKRLGNITALAWATERYQQERARMARLRERQLIADELHDRVAQILYGVKLTLEVAAEKLDHGAPSLSAVERACQMLARGEVETRNIIDRLSSGEEPDLAAQLRAVVQSVEEDFDVSIRLDVDGQAQTSGLTQAAADAAVGAAREAMINAAKHAGPCRVFVSLSVTPDRQLELKVVDDGVGWQQDQQQGYGLEAVRRRLRVHGGEVRFGTGTYGGAEVLVLLPLV